MLPQVATANRQWPLPERLHRDDQAPARHTARHRQQPRRPALDRQLSDILQRPGQQGAELRDRGGERPAPGLPVLADDLRGDPADAEGDAGGFGGPEGAGHQPEQKPAALLGGAGDGDAADRPPAGLALLETQRSARFAVQGFRTEHRGGRQGVGPRLAEAGRRRVRHDDRPPDRTEPPLQDQTLAAANLGQRC